MQKALKNKKQKTNPTSSTLGYLQARTYVVSAYTALQGFCWRDLTCFMSNSVVHLMLQQVGFSNVVPLGLSYVFKILYCLKLNLDKYSLYPVNLSLSYSKVQCICLFPHIEASAFYFVVLKCNHYVQLVVYVKLIFFFLFFPLPLLCLFLTSTWRVDGKSSSGWQFSSTLQEREREIWLE